MKEKHTLVFSDACSVDLRSAELICTDGRRKRLSKKLYDLVQVIADHPNALLSADQLLKLVWQDEYYSATGDPRLVRDLIRRLRNMDAAIADCIITKPGLGYQFQLPSAAEAEKPWEILPTNALHMESMDISRRIMDNDSLLYTRVPEVCKGSQAQWACMFDYFSDYCRFLVDSRGIIQGNFSIIGLSWEQEQQIAQGTLVDSDINIFSCDNLQEKGDHAIYLLNLSVNPGVEIAKYNLLWDSLIDLIKDCARDGVFFSRIFYKAFLPEYEAKVLGRGFDKHCNDAIYGTIYVHNMDADRLRILDEELASLYRSRHSRPVPKSTPAAPSGERFDVERAYHAFFKQIDELFLQPRICSLKPYFFDGKGLPRDPGLNALGVATAELLRDILQYSASFLDYLPDYRSSYSDYAQTLMNCELVKQSIGEYQFTTEKTRDPLTDSDHSDISVKDLISFARIWTGIDQLFLREELLPIRPYFYDQKKKRSLPDDAMMDQAVALTVRILTGMKLSEAYLGSIPHPYVISYFDYKDMMKNVRLVQEVIHRYPFLRDELNW